MYSIKASAEFDSAHFLNGYEGKCANLHGHRWKIEVTASKEDLKADGQCRGMVIDFGDLKNTVRKIADEYDHAFIYEQGSLKKATEMALLEENFRLVPVPFRPTAECFAVHFFEMLMNEGIPVKSVAVYETPENCAVYEE